MSILTSIPTTLTSTVTTVMDSILNSSIGKSCVVYYAPIQSGCSNCSPSPVGDKSANIYLQGGPSPFYDGQLCPLCYGAYFMAVEQSEPLTMTIKWLPANYRPDFPGGNEYANATILTRGWATDLQKVLNSSYMEFDQEGGYNHYRFKRMGQPTFSDQFTDCRYFYAYWKQT